MRNILAIVAMSVLLSSCGSENKAGGAAQATDSNKNVEKKPVEKPASVRQGPFGVEMAMPVAEIKSAIKKAPTYDEPGFLVYETAPRPYPGLDHYLFLAGAKAGLCKVVGSSEVTSNSFGHQVEEKADALVAAVSEKYGKPTGSFNKVFPGSIWNDPDDFMMGLLKEERKLVYIWDGKELDLPNNLESISVEAKGLSTDTARVALSYEFKNFDDCIAESKDASRQAL